MTYSQSKSSAKAPAVAGTQQGTYQILTTLHGYPMIGPYVPSTKDVWYCDNKDCRQTRHGVYAKYKIENWKSSKFGKKYVLCDGCVRQYVVRQPLSNAAAHPQNINMNVQMPHMQPQPHPHQIQYVQQPQVVYVQQPVAVHHPHMHMQSMPHMMPMGQMAQMQQRATFPANAVAGLPPQQQAYRYSANAQGFNGMQPQQQQQQQHMHSQSMTGAMYRQQPQQPQSYNPNMATAAHMNNGGTQVALKGGKSNKEGNNNNNSGGNDSGLVKVVKKGYMMKKGDFTKSWKKRYFVLKSNLTLNYYETQRAATVQGTVSLDNLKSVKSKSKQSFEISDQKRVWCFACADTKDRDSWVTAVKSVAKIK